MGILKTPLKIRKDGGPVTIQVLVENGEKGYTGVELWTDMDHDHKIDPDIDHRDVLKHVSEPPDDPVTCDPEELTGKFLLYGWRTLRRYGSNGKWRVEIIIRQGDAAVEGCPAPQTGKYKDGENVNDGWVAQWVEVA